MNQEKDLYLVENFPHLYRDRNGDMRSTAMCWGFDVDDGWYEIILELSTKLSALDLIPVATQVKEKYGTLRFYVHTGSDEAWELIDQAEAKSAITCESCGNVGKLLNSNGARYGWLKTLCAPCSARDGYAEYAWPVDDA